MVYMPDGILFHPEKGDSAICDNTDLESIMLSEVSQTKKNAV